MSTISKELLSEVLGVYVRNGWYFDCVTLVYTYDKISGLDENYHAEINIYELAHMCKEWAKLKYFIDIDSHSGCARWGAEAVSHNGRPSVFYEQVFIGRTEPEAIFKACEWILKELK